MATVWGWIKMHRHNVSNCLPFKKGRIRAVLLFWFHLIDITDLPFFPSSLVWSGFTRWYELVRPCLTWFDRTGLTCSYWFGQTRFDPILCSLTYLTGFFLLELTALGQTFLDRTGLTLKILIFYSTIQLVTRFCRLLLIKFFLRRPKVFTIFLFLNLD